MSQSQHEKRKAKLAALQAKAADKCNEHEAMAAMEALHHYAAEWGISLDDIETGADSTSADNWKASDGSFSSRGYGNVGMCDKFVTTTLAETFACKAWLRPDADGDTQVVFFGHAVDVEAVTAIRLIIIRTMRFEWELYKEHEAAARRLSKRNIVDAKLSFHKAMGLRLKERLAFFTRQDTATTAGNQLVVVKHQLTTRHWDAYAAQNNLNLGRMHVNMHGGNARAAAAGYTAGNRVDLGAGRSVGGAVLRLGKS